MLFDSVLIIGLGLIGGSLALDVKGLNIANKVIGCSRSESTLKAAIDNNVVDEVYDDISEAVPKADLIVVCVPVSTSEKIFKLIKDSLGDKKVLVTDAGSTKAGVVEAASVFSGSNAEFIGSHPIAGSHLQGIKNARKGLFKNAVCVITPTEKSPADTVNRLKKFWTALGMKVIELDPEKHDIILALTSHLPHAVASSLVSQISADSDNLEMLITLSGTGHWMIQPG
jgi:prephenate dehydrogenase